MPSETTLRLIARAGIFFLGLLIWVKELKDRLANLTSSRLPIPGRLMALNHLM